MQRSARNGEKNRNSQTIVANVKAISLAWRSNNNNSITIRFELFAWHVSDSCCHRTLAKLLLKSFLLLLYFFYLQLCYYFPIRTSQCLAIIGAQYFAMIFLQLSFCYSSRRLLLFFQIVFFYCFLLFFIVFKLFLLALTAMPHGHLAGMPVSCAIRATFDLFSCQWIGLPCRD